MSEKYYNNIKMKKLNNKIDPYELLEIPKNIMSLKKLNKIYKQLCLEYHPDRGGSELTFKIMQEAIKEIQQDIIDRISYKSHNQLKQNSTNNYDKVTQDISGINPETISFKKFNNSKFNHFFEENKIEDENNYGYSEKILKIYQVNQILVIAIKKNLNKNLIGERKNIINIIKL